MSSDLHKKSVDNHSEDKTTAGAEGTESILTVSGALPRQCHCQTDKANRDDEGLSDDGKHTELERFSRDVTLINVDSEVNETTTSVHVIPNPKTPRLEVTNIHILDDEAGSHSPDRCTIQSPSVVDKQSNSDVTGNSYRQLSGTSCTIEDVTPGEKQQITQVSSQQPAINRQPQLTVTLQGSFKQEAGANETRAVVISTDKEENEKANITVVSESEVGDQNDERTSYSEVKTTAALFCSSQEEADTILPCVNGSKITTGSTSIMNTSGTLKSDLETISKENSYSNRNPQVSHSDAMPREMLSAHDVSLQQNLMISVSSSSSCYSKENTQFDKKPYMNTEPALSESQACTCVEVVDSIDESISDRESTTDKITIIKNTCSESLTCTPQKQQLQGTLEPVQTKQSQPKECSTVAVCHTMNNKVVENSTETTDSELDQKASTDELRSQSHDKMEDDNEQYSSLRADKVTNTKLSTSHPSTSQVMKGEQEQISVMMMDDIEFENECLHDSTTDMQLDDTKQYIHKLNDLETSSINSRWTNVSNGEPKVMERTAAEKKQSNRVATTGTLPELALPNELPMCVAKTACASVNSIVMKADVRYGEENDTATTVKDSKHQVCGEHMGDRTSNSTRTQDKPFTYQLKELEHERVVQVINYQESSESPVTVISKCEKTNSTTVTQGDDSMSNYPRDGTKHQSSVATLSLPDTRALQVDDTSTLDACIDRSTNIKLMAEACMTSCDGKTDQDVITEISGSSIICEQNNNREKPSRKAETNLTKKETCADVRQENDVAVSTDESKPAACDQTEEKSPKLVLFDMIAPQLEVLGHGEVSLFINENNSSELSASTESSDHEMTSEKSGQNITDKSKSQSDSQNQETLSDKETVTSTVKLNVETCDMSVSTSCLCIAEFEPATVSKVIECQTPNAVNATDNHVERVNQKPNSEELKYQSSYQKNDSFSNAEQNSSTTNNHDNAECHQEYFTDEHKFQTSHKKNDSCNEAELISTFTNKTCSVSTISCHDHLVEQCEDKKEVVQIPEKCMENPGILDGQCLHTSVCDNLHHGSTVNDFEASSSSHTISPLNKAFSTKSDRKTLINTHPLHTETKSQPEEVLSSCVQTWSNDYSITDKFECQSSDQPKSCSIERSLSSVTSNSGGTAERRSDVRSNSDEKQTQLKSYTKQMNIDQCKYGTTPLHLASERGLLKAVKVLVEEFDFDLNLRDTNYQATALHRACESGHLNIVKYFFSVLGCDPEVKDMNGLTPLHYATRKGHFGVVKFLCNEVRCILDTRDNEQQTALHYACHYGHDVIFNYFVRNKGCNVEIVDQEMRTPLHFACEFRHSDMVYCLVHELKCNVNAEDVMKRTPLHYACTWWWHIRFDDDRTFSCRVIEVLLEDPRCDINKTTKKGDTALHLACKTDRFDIVHCLLSRPDCNPNIRNKAGETPLKLTSHLGVIAELTSRGANPMLNVLYKWQRKNVIFTPCLKSWSPEQIRELTHSGKTPMELFIWLIKEVPEYQALEAI